MPRGTRWLVAAVAAVVLAVAVTWVLFVPVADWLAHHDVGSAKGSLHETAVDNARGRLLTLGAGLVAVAALVFTALNFSLLRRNSEKTDQWQRRTHELTEQGQVTDRYTKAIEQLGSDKLDVRIGGIYALGRIASDSARDHPTVIEVLSAFVREHSREHWPPLPGDDQPSVVLPELMIRPDVEAAVLVVMSRNASHDRQRVNLTAANLAGANLLYANLAHAILNATILAGAHLAHANLAHVIGYDANLAGADLALADLADATLVNATCANVGLLAADLTGAHLTGADLTSADLTNAKLRGASLDRANLTNADLTGAKLRHVHFNSAALTGAKWPRKAPVPEGWKRDTASGRLEAAADGSGPAEAN